MKMNRIHCVFYGTLALLLVWFFYFLFSVPQDRQVYKKNTAKPEIARSKTTLQTNSAEFSLSNHQPTSTTKALSFEEGLAKFRAKQNEFRKRRAERILKYPGSLELSLSVQNSKRDSEYVSYLREMGINEEKIAELIELVHDRNHLREMHKIEFFSKAENYSMNQKEQKASAAEIVRPFEEKISAILHSKENRDDFDRWEETAGYRDSVTKFVDSLGATFEPNIIRQMAETLRQLQLVKNQPANMMDSARSLHMQKQTIRDQMQRVLPPAQLERFIQFATKPPAKGGTTITIAE